MKISPERYIVDTVQEKYSKDSDSKYKAWERNVIDKYKTLSNDEIKNKVEANRLPYAILMTHINIDYNLGAVLRVGNCLGAKVFYFGQKKWDKRGAIGVWNYSPINYLKSLDELIALKQFYSFVALEQDKKSVSLHKFSWPKHKQPLIIVGEESKGLQETPDIYSLADFVVEIKQRGSIRSLNAATSVSIAAYDFLYKNNYFEQEIK